MAILRPIAEPILTESLQGIVKSFFDDLGLGIMLISKETGKIAYSNPAASELFNEREVVGINIIPILPGINLSSLGANQELGSLVVKINNFVMNEDYLKVQVQKQDPSRQLAHDLRNTFGSIGPLLDMLRNASSEEERENILKMTERSYGAGMRILSSMLLNKESERNFTFEEIKNLIDAQVRSFENEQDITFTLEIDPKIPAQVFGNDVLLFRTLGNLVRNAYIHAFKNASMIEDKRVTLRISPLIEELEDETEVPLLFEVIDNGIGIQQRESPTLEFAGADRDTPILNKSFGIGMTSVGACVKEMGGTFVEALGSEEEITSGTTWRIELTLNAAKPEEELRSTTPAVLKDHRIGQLQAHDLVIIVDDSQIMRMLPKRLLEKRFGYTNVHEFDSVQSAREFLEEENILPALAFIDVQMPTGDGIELVNYLREKATGRSKSPLIYMLTGDGRSRTPGADRTIRKPPTPDLLGPLLRNFSPPKSASAGEGAGGASEARSAFHVLRE